MQETAILIGASNESLFAIYEAKKAGLKIVAFDGDKNAPGLKQADISFIMDIKNPLNIIKTLQTNNIRPSLILPVPLGRCLVSSCAVDEYFKLKGASFNAGDLCTDKLKFHQHLQNLNASFTLSGGANLAKSECFLINESLDESLLKFPLIIKPRFGSGSKDCMAIKNLNEFRNFINSVNIKSNDFLAQTLIKGVEYGLDGVVIDGEFKHILLRQKLLTPLPYRQSIANLSVKEIQKISVFMQAIIQSLKIENSLINADIIITPSGKPFIIELAPRPSGHYLSSNFNQIVTGVNALKEWINFSLNKPFDFKPKFFKNAIIRYFDCEGDVKIPNFQALKNKLNIIDYKCNINKTLGKVTNGANLMWRGYAIILAPTSQKCLENAQILMNEFKG